MQIRITIAARKRLNNGHIPTSCCRILHRCCSNVFVYRGCYSSRFSQMKKIPTLFRRNATGLVFNEVTPGCEWVLAGEGIATIKFDGTCCLWKDGKLFKRRELRVGDIIPQDFVEADRDPITLKIFGWIPVGDGPQDQWHREPLRNHLQNNQTYELCGPKINGNPDNLTMHHFFEHGLPFPEHLTPPREFAALKAWLPSVNTEGIVWWHADGRKAKLKTKDFGLKRHANDE